MRTTTSAITRHEVQCCTHTTYLVVPPAAVSTGLIPLAVGASATINLLYQFWLYTDLAGRMGSLEWVFNTPSHNRVHHASNREYLDRNYGDILIV
jgi:sterol desaturase/sphingolipid hydroxylase (fatty acid hydroxylase superfamily)